MMHLTEDQIYHLVEAIGNHETLTADCLLYTSPSPRDS